jgi:DNA polymerase III subunit epsilon
MGRRPKGDRAMTYLVVDTETSGLLLRAPKGAPPIPADAPGQPRLAQLGLVWADADLNVEHSVQHTVRPDGWTMDPGATAVNGLTTEHLLRIGVPVGTALADYWGGLVQHRIVVAYNSVYDTKVLRGEFRRAGLPDRFETTMTIDVMEGVQALLRRGWVSMAKACAALGVEPEPTPHEALGGALCCLALARVLKAQGHLPAPRIRRAKGYAGPARSTVEEPSVSVGDDPLYGAAGLDGPLEDTVEATQRNMGVTLDSHIYPAKEE